MNDIAISVKDLHKSFKLPRERSNGLKQAIINFTRGKRGYEIQKVLRGLDFEIKKGEFFGIVGRNGSGKSTLLKVLAQIYQPEKGSVHIDGSLVPFIELGVGFNPELTGRENVYMNGALLGFSNSEMDEMYQEIVDFAELERFMDQKLKNYSSGMQVRLAFSIAIRANTDILLLDEILAVGDEAFQRKCYTHFAKLKKENKTVILVTHSMEQVQQFCSRALFIQDGKVTLIGNPAKVASAYREANSANTKHDGSTSNSTMSNDYLEISSMIRTPQDKVIFEMNLLPKKNIDDAVITFVLSRDTGEWVYRFVTDEQLRQKISFSAGKRQRMRLELDNIFCNGVFSAQVGVKSRDRTQDFIVIDNAAEFEIVNKGSYPNDMFWKPRSEFFYE